MGSTTGYTAKQHSHHLVTQFIQKKTLSTQKEIYLFFHFILFNFIYLKNLCFLSL